jgi:transposase
VPREHGVNPHKLFDKRAFVYEAEADRYRCPAGEYLHYRGTNTRDRMRQYRATSCTGCPLKAQCTQARVRTVTRHEEEAALERMDRRARDNPQILRRRKATVEHVFGTLKSLIPRFLMRGLAHVKTEISLAALAYNLKRMMVLRGAAAFSPA